MSEETKPQDQATQQDQETTKPEISQDIKDLIKSEVDSVKESYKKEISGLNKRNSELEKTLEEKELESLGEKERAEKELENLKKQAETEKQETERLRRERLIDGLLFDAGLPQDFAKRITGQTEDEIKEDIKSLNDFVNQLVEEKSKSEINKKLGGKSPEGTDKTEQLTQRDKLIAEYNEAEKQGDAVKMMTLKDQIERLPKD